MFLFAVMSVLKVFFLSKDLLRNWFKSTLKCQAFGLGANITPRKIIGNLATSASRVSAISVDARVPSPP